TFAELVPDLPGVDPAHLIADPIRRAHIRILHLPEYSVVTRLELLSPHNKTGEGFSENCAKRTTILQQKVPLVELHSLVGGPRLPLGDPFEGGGDALLARFRLLRFGNRLHVFALVAGAEMLRMRPSPSCSLNASPGGLPDGFEQLRVSQAVIWVAPLL